MCTYVVIKKQTVWVRPYVSSYMVNIPAELTSSAALYMTCLWFMFSLTVHSTRPSLIILLRSVKALQSNFTEFSVCGRGQE